MDGQPETSGAAAAAPVILPFKITDMQEPHRLGQSADDPFGWGLDILEGIELVRPKHYEFDYAALFGKVIKRCDLVLADGCQKAILHFVDGDRATIGPSEPCEPGTNFVLRIDNSLFDKLRELPGLEFTVARSDPPRRSFVLEKALVGEREVKPEAYHLPADYHLAKHMVVGLKLRDPDEVPTRRTPNRLKWVSWMSCSERTRRTDESGHQPDFIVFRDLRLSYDENLEGEPSDPGEPLPDPYSGDRWAREESPPSPPESPPAKPFPKRTHDPWVKPRASAARGKGKGKAAAVEDEDETEEPEPETADEGAADEQQETETAEEDAGDASDDDDDAELLRAATISVSEEEESLAPRRRRGGRGGGRAGAAAATAAAPADDDDAAETGEGTAARGATTAAKVAATKRKSRAKKPVATADGSAATALGRGRGTRARRPRATRATGTGRGRGRAAAAGRGTTTDAVATTADVAATVAAETGAEAAPAGPSRRGAARTAKKKAEKKGGASEGADVEMEEEAREDDKDADAMDVDDDDDDDDLYGA